VWKYIVGIHDLNQKQNASIGKEFHASEAESCKKNSEGISISAAENHKVILSRLELPTCRGESATDQLLIVEGFVRTAKHHSR
jgi:hypothetical protein